MYSVYILLSQRNGKKYVGYTEKQPEQRLFEHNHGSNTWTGQNGPFNLIYSENFISRHAAIKQEAYLKSGAGRKYLKKILGAVA